VCPLCEAVPEAKPLDHLPARQAEIVCAADDQPADGKEILVKAGVERGHVMLLWVLVPEEIAAMPDP
jgi:hypothetical protein